MNNYERNICQAIETITKQAIINANHCSCIIATIVECINPLIGKYKVKYHNANFIAYGNSNIIYNKNSLVYIMMPEGKIDDIMYIIGSLNYNNISLPIDSTNIQLTLQMKNNHLYPILTYNNATMAIEEMRSFTYSWYGDEQLLSDKEFLLDTSLYDYSVYRCSINIYGLTIESSTYIK